jgi:hypothetical protein
MIAGNSLKSAAIRQPLAGRQLTKVQATFKGRLYGAGKCPVLAGTCPKGYSWSSAIAHTEDSGMSDRNAVDTGP